MSVRIRVLTYLTALTGIALAVAGSTAFAIERARLDNEIGTDLTLRADDLHTLVAEGDPVTGATFVDAESILREAMRRVVASPTESAVALLAGEARFVPGGDEILRLETDDALLAAATDAATSGTVAVQSLTTEQADYRFLAVPIADATGAVQGVMVYAADHGAIMSALVDTFEVYVVVALISLAAIAVFGYVTVGRLLEPIRLLDQTARRISTTDLSDRIPIVGNDDLARLSETVNQMLDRIERAFSDQSQLLDDASHELRTPLTIVRNRLELLEPRDSEAVVAARDELLDEVTRMSRLVDDLVTLAKADRPEFLRLAPVDLAELTDVALSRASQLGPRIWTTEAIAEGVVEADAERLTQAWLQLSANAVRFSEPGTAITLGSEVRVTVDGVPEFRLWVRDEGIGIAHEDIERIRSRFGRVDTRVDGTGLGLPIVTAIAEAHEGRLDIESTPGRGSTFSIVAPAYAPRHEEPAPASPWDDPAAEGARA
ncbi:sensor histidine kinase [Demequina zhanjiangensis]|uniref:histidine kinase n=1 Tax=Demequina zhanjiangensis TaxID=3051659 RepID=A0ABT8FXJ3_9MICO|nr:HAMP domain-containing sensor histidine kinase [Demequina sp. SYSU T00b26]MDN4471472.1 HAMP domain-containing sensor histidine kinase [Demequina sp. SYSU T00b26]